MISINSVYTTVLAILNKENRGYVPPFDFNKLAKQAQLEIFESYFYDLAHFGISQKGKIYSSGYSSVTKSIKEKIDIFETIISLDYTNGIFEAPENLYRLDTLIYNNDGIETIVEMMNKDMSTYIINSKKTAPSKTYPKYLRLENNFKVFPSTINEESTVSAYYIRKPSIPIWGYLNLGSDDNPTGTLPGSGDRGVPLYDAGRSVDFELHPSDEYKLVEKILSYAGVITREAEIVQFAQAELGQDTQTEKQ